MRESLGSMEGGITLIMEFPYMPTQALGELHMPHGEDLTLKIIQNQCRGNNVCQQGSSLNAQQSTRCLCGCRADTLFSAFTAAPSYLLKSIPPLSSRITSAL